MDKEYSDSIEPSESKMNKGHSGSVEPSKNKKDKECSDSVEPSKNKMDKEHSDSVEPSENKMDKEHSDSIESSENKMDKEHSGCEEPGELPDSDNEDIYGDIADFDLGREVDKLRAENALLEEKIHSLHEAIEKLKGGITALRNTQKNLENNISSLYITAKAEIDRKNKQIAELQRELDDFKFRRKRPSDDVQFPPQKRARYENDEEQTNHSRLAYPLIDSQYNNVEGGSDSIRHRDSHRPLTEFSRQKQKDFEESRGHMKEGHEGLSTNQKRVRHNDQAGDRHTTLDNIGRKSDVDISKDRELENKLSRDRESKHQFNGSRKHQNYEDTRGYREERYEGLSRDQRRVRHNDQAGDRRDTPDSEDRKSDDGNRVTELENRLGKDRGGNRQFGRNRHEEYQELRGYRERRYGEFGNERRDRDRHDHPKNRLGRGYHKEQDMYDDRGYREGRGGVRERGRDRSIGRDKDNSKERFSNHDRDRGRSRDRRSTSERSSSRESRHKNRNDPKKEILNNEMRPTVADKHPENAEAKQVDLRSHVQVSKIVTRKKLKVVQKLEESMSRSPRKMSQNMKLNTSSDISTHIDTCSKMTTSDGKKLLQKQSTSDTKILVLSNIVLSDGSGEKGEVSSTAEEPLGTKSSKEAGDSDDLTQIQNFLSSEGLSFRNKNKNKVSNECTTGSPVGTDSESTSLRVESKSTATDGDKKDKSQSLKKITLDAYKDRNQNSKCEKKHAEVDIGKNNELNKDLKTKEDIQKDLEAEGLIFRDKSTYSSAAVKEKDNINTDEVAETKSINNETVKHNIIETVVKEGSEANEDINRKEASVGLLLLGMKEDIKTTTGHLLSEGKSSISNVESNVVETGTGQIDVTSRNEDIKVSTVKDTKDVERGDIKKERNSDFLGSKKSNRHTAVTEKAEVTKSQKKAATSKASETNIETHNNNRSATLKSSNSSENIKEDKSKVHPEQIGDTVLDGSRESQDICRNNNVKETEIALNLVVKNQDENHSTREVRTSPRKKGTGKQSLTSDLQKKIKSLFDESMDASEVSAAVRPEIKSSQNIDTEEELRATKANKSNADHKTDGFQADIKQNCFQEIKNGKYKDADRDSHSNNKNISDLDKKEHKRVEEQKETTKVRSSPRKKKVAEQKLSSSSSQKRGRNKSTSRKSESDQVLKKQKIEATDQEEKRNVRKNSKNKTEITETLKAGFEKLNRQIDAVAAGVTESQKVGQAVQEVKESKTKNVANTQQKVLKDISSVGSSVENDKIKENHKVLSSVDHPNEKKIIPTNDSQVNPHVIVIEEKIVVAECKASFNCLSNTPENPGSEMPKESPPDDTPENKKIITRKRITPTPVTDTNKPASFGDMLKKCETPVAAKAAKNLMIEHNLHLTHEGDIPLLHIEESHIDSLPNEDLRNPDSSLMRLIDTMTLSNMECELPKAHDGNHVKEQGSVVKESTELSFENLMYKVSSSPVHVTSTKSPDVNVTSAKSPHANVTSAKSLDANVTSAKTHNANVSSAKSLDANITSAKSLDANVTFAKSPDANVTTARSLDANVSSAKRPDADTTSTKSLDANITSAKSPDANVTSAKGPDAKVTSAKSPDANVTSAKGLDANVCCNSNIDKNNVRDAVTDRDGNRTVEVISTNGNDVTSASDASVTAGVTVNSSSGGTSGATAKTPMKRKKRIVRLIISD